MLRIDVRDEERRLMQPAGSTMRDISSAHDVGRVVRLADDLRGHRRFAPPTRRDVDCATESIERALRDGRLVGIRRDPPAGGGGLSQSLLRADSTPDIAPPSAPAVSKAEDTLTWFEVTLLGHDGAPLSSLDLDFVLAGRTRRVRTDENGTIRIENVEGSMGSVRPSNLAGLREKLLTLDANPAAIAGQPSHDVGATMDAISVYSSLPITVVLCAREERWIGIELLDSLGQPVSGAQYRLTSSLGAVIVGRLDSMGRARVVLADGGSYMVAFPELDGVSSAGSRPESST